MRVVGPVLALSVMFATSSARAENPPPTADPAQEPVEQLHWQAGPLKLNLGHDIEVKLPEHYVFLGMPDADKLMQKLGNFYNKNLLGVIVSDADEARWFISVRYSEDGHVDDKEKIDADELLKTIHDGTEEANEERKKRGFPPAHVQGWTEAPRYDSSVHHLVWALTLKSDDGDSLNYNTRVLGRRGVVSLNLVTPPDRLAADREHATAMLEATTFVPGARYQDFDKSKDKVAEYGLMGLILGGAGLGAAKLVKIGLIAKFWKVIIGILLAGKKAIVAFFLLIGAGIKRLLGRKPAQPPSESATPPQPKMDVSPTLTKTEEPKPPTGTDEGPPPGA
jgi:uncharacterized membrane-anchored protein